MSNDIIDSSDVIEVPGTTRPRVKDTISAAPAIEEKPAQKISPEDLKRLSALLAQHSPENVDVRVATKIAPVRDFRNLTQDSIYDPNLYMEAKPFMAGDPLKVTLKDTNYEARWVNQQSMRLGWMKAIGFTYVSPEDIEGNLELDITTDSNGHYSFHDVVLMRIPKAQYFPALRAAHQRAMAVISSKQASRNGSAAAIEFMQNSSDGGDFAEARQSNKMEFYNPGN